MKIGKWKAAGIALFLAAAGCMPVYAAQSDPILTEYDEATLEKFRDNTLEYGSPLSSCPAAC